MTNTFFDVAFFSVATWRLRRGWVFASSSSCSDSELSSWLEPYVDRYYNINTWSIHETYMRNTWQIHDKYMRNVFDIFTLFWRVFVLAAAAAVVVSVFVFCVAVFVRRVILGTPRMGLVSITSSSSDSDGVSPSLSAPCSQIILVSQPSNNKLISKVSKPSLWLHLGVFCGEAYHPVPTWCRPRSHRCQNPSRTPYAQRTLQKPGIQHACKSCSSFSLLFSRLSLTS